MQTKMVNEGLQKEVLKENEHNELNKKNQKECFK